MGESRQPRGALLSDANVSVVAHLLVELQFLDQVLGSRDPSDAEATRDDLAEGVQANDTTVNIHGEERANGLVIRVR